MVMMCNLAKEKTLELYFFSFKFRLIETRKLRSEIYFYIYLRIEKLKIECNFQFLKKSNGRMTHACITNANVQSIYAERLAIFFLSRN